jgi:hypothetical protein
MKMIITKSFKYHTLKISILLLLLPMFIQKAKSQPNTLYFIDRVHQADYLNPATQSCCNGFLTLPAISGTSVIAGNTGFDYNDLIHPGTGLLQDSLILDIENVKSKLGDKNYVIAETFVPIFGFGFWYGNSFITFEISNRTIMNTGYPKSLVALAGGNADFIGETNPADISNFGPELINYNEFAFGWSKKITHRLTIGTKLKILSGLACVQKHRSNIKLFTADTTYAMRLETDLDYNISAPAEFEYDDNGLISGINYNDSNLVQDLSPTKNFGLGIDFGAIYQLNDKWKFYASVTDLGFIRWNKNSKHIFRSGVFEYSGLTLDSVWNDSDYNEFKAWGDSIASFFHFDHAETKFTSILNTNLYIGANYQIAPFLSFGLLSKTYLFDKSIHQAFTFSANFKPIKSISVSMSYSIMNREYKNIGFGLALNLGPLQFYIVTDNIYTAFMPKNSKLAGIMVGLNLNFGCGKRDNYSMLNNNYPDKKIDFM